MGFRPTFNYIKCGNLTPLVDKTIGNAYPVVRHVSDNMAALLAITDRDAQDRFIQGTAGLRGQTVIVPLSPDIAMNQIRSSTVQIRDTELSLWGIDSGHFTTVVKNSGLEVTLKATAPLTMQGAPILWNLTYGVNNG